MNEMLQKKEKRWKNFRGLQVVFKKLNLFRSKHSIYLWRHELPASAHAHCLDQRHAAQQQQQRRES